MANGVGVAKEYFSGSTHRYIVFLPHPERFEQDLPLVIGKVVKAVQRCADPFDHHLWGGDRGGGQHRSRRTPRLSTGVRPGSASSPLQSAKPVAFHADRRSERSFRYDL